MTKADIKVELKMLLQVVQYHSSRSSKLSDDPMDFYDAQHRAYEDCAERIDKLIDKCFG